MYCQQGGRFLDGKLAVRTGLDGKMRDARASVAARVAKLAMSCSAPSYSMNSVHIGIACAEDEMMMRRQRRVGQMERVGIAFLDKAQLMALSAVFRLSGLCL